MTSQLKLCWTYSTACTSVGGVSLTMSVNVTVSLAEPLTMIAVKVTVASPLPNGGVITVPVLDMTEGLLETQKIAVPFVPLTGRVRSVSTNICSVFMP